MNSLVRDALFQLLPRKGEWVFAKSDGTPYTSVCGFNRARKAAGLSVCHGPYLTAYICNPIDRERSRFAHGPGTRRVVRSQDARTLWARLPFPKGGGGRRSNPPAYPPVESAQSRNRLKKSSKPRFNTGDSPAHVSTVFYCRLPPFTVVSPFYSPRISPRAVYDPIQLDD